MDPSPPKSIAASPSPPISSSGTPAALAPLAPMALSRIQNSSPHTGVSTTPSQHGPTASPAPPPSVPLGRPLELSIPTTNTRTLQRQSSRTFSTATASSKGKESAEARPEAGSSMLSAVEPAEKEAFDHLSLTPPPPSETATQARNRTNDNITRLAVVVHHLKQNTESEQRIVIEGIQDLAAVQASLRETLDMRLTESVMQDVQVPHAPSMPPTLAVFDEWKDMHEAVRTIMEGIREHSNTTTLLQLQMGEVRDRVPDLEKQIAELRGRLSQATNNPPLQPLPSLASSVAPPSSLFASPYLSAHKHASVDLTQPGAKRFHHDPTYTDVLVEGVKADEGTSSLVKKILNAADTAFPTVIAGYRMNDHSLPPHVVIRFKTADSASQFVWIATERCPASLQGCRFTLIQRPPVQSTHSYEFLQPKSNGTGSASIRAPGFGMSDAVTALGPRPMGW